MKRKKSEYLYLGLTLLASFIISTLFVFQYIVKNDRVKIKLMQLSKQHNITSDNRVLLIILASIVAVIVLFILSFIFNKIILKFIHTEVDSIKLAIGVLISFNFIFMIGILFITYANIRLFQLMLISIIIDTAILSILISKELDKKIIKYLIIRIAFWGLFALSKIII